MRTTWVTLAHIRQNAVDHDTQNANTRPSCSVACAFALAPEEAASRQVTAIPARSEVPIDSTTTKYVAEQIASFRYQTSTSMRSQGVELHNAHHDIAPLSALNCMRRALHVRQCCPLRYGGPGVLHVAMRAHNF